VLVSSAGYEKRRVYLAVACLFLYGACLVVLLPRLSFWQDEVYDLIGARQRTLSGLLQYVQRTPGAVPLGYLIQATVIKILGFSVFSARLPSVVSSLAGSLGIFWLARLSGVSSSLLAAVAFAVCPLQLRYALEARSYAIALALSVYASVLFLLLLRQPRPIGLLLLYGVCITAGIYTQPFSLFVPVAHLAWLCLLSDEWKRRRGLIVSVSIIILASALSFLPWYLYSSDLWKQSITTYHLHGAVTFRSLLLVLHEFVGMGYLGTAIVLSGVIVALISVKIRRADLAFCVLYIIVPVIGGLAVDRSFGYFVAIRQFLCVIAPVALVVAISFETGTRTGIALAIAFIFVGLWNDVKLFTRPREDWQSAASVLMLEAKRGACILFAPAESIDLYTFFQPELSGYQCTGNFEQRDRVTIAVSPSDVERSQLNLERHLAEHGFHRVGDLNATMPRLEEFQR